MDDRVYTKNDMIKFGTRILKSVYLALLEKKYKLSSKDLKEISKGINKYLERW
jgi:hypothetical protein